MIEIRKGTRKQQQVIGNPLRTLSGNCSPVIRTEKPKAGWGQGVGRRQRERGREKERERGGRRDVVVGTLAL